MNHNPKKPSMSYGLADDGYREVLAVIRDNQTGNLFRKVIFYSKAKDDLRFAPLFFDGEIVMRRWDIVSFEELPPI